MKKREATPNFRSWEKDYIGDTTAKNSYSYFETHGCFRALNLEL